MNKNIIKEVSFKNEKVIHKNKNYYLNDKPFGVLTQDENSPLFSVSVSNSSLSIDIWSGCAYACKYCHVQGIYTYIKEDGKMKKNPVLNTKYTIEEIVDSLIKHPFFEKDKTIISICTSSTEPFATKKVTDSTIEIMETFVKKNLKNPFWIVTKAGIPKNIVSNLEKIALNGNKIMLSMCWAGNPKEIEPARTERLKNIDLVKNIDNIYVSWYLRPLVKEWGANSNNLEKMFKYVKDNYDGYIDMIVPGGMRWTSGIEYALTEINHIKMPNLIKDDNKKTLDDEIVDTINQLAKKYFKDIPVFYNSSCALSYMLNKSSITLVNNFKEKNCLCSNCPKHLRELCNKNMVIKDLNGLNKNLLNMGIDINFTKIDLKNHEIISEPSMDSFGYAIKQIIIRSIAEYKNELTKENSHEVVR